MNMPVEMGMALFYALNSQRRDHRCVFFISSPHEHGTFASDLAGLDPRVHNGDETRVLADMYEWLRAIVPPSLFNVQTTVDVQQKFAEFKARRDRIRGSANGGRPSHDESQELMYSLCGELGWWDYRAGRMGQHEFPVVPIAFWD